MVKKTFQWTHLIFGIGTSVFILFYSTTGTILAYREYLNLHQVPVRSQIGLWLYGEPKVFRVAGEEIMEEYPPSWEKALTAWHGGTFRGKEYAWFPGMAGIGFFLLAISGPYLWLCKVIRIKNRRSCI